jgi:hypothetical protein
LLMEIAIFLALIVEFTQYIFLERINYYIKEQLLERALAIALEL